MMADMKSQSQRFSLARIGRQTILKVWALYHRVRKSYRIRSICQIYSQYYANKSVNRSHSSDTDCSGNQLHEKWPIKGRTKPRNSCPIQVTITCSSQNTKTTEIFVMTRCCGTTCMLFLSPVLSESHFTGFNVARAIIVSHDDDERLLRRAGSPGSIKST